MDGIPARISIKELETSLASVRGLEIVLGKVVRDDWDEKMGPTPYPSVTTLRAWDHRLLQRYEPFYSPLCDMCCLCTYGKCDLTAGKKGACGIDIRTQQGKIVLLACLMGAAAHATHSRHVLDYLIKKRGSDFPISLGDEVILEAPIIRTVAGIRPKTLGDLEEVVDYVTSQIAQLLSATATGQESNYLDYESKALHAGMLDNVALEISDIAQISGLNFPKGDPNAALVDLGMGIVDKSKPIILCVGHNVAPGAETIDFLEKEGLYGRVEVAGICCTAHDLARYRSGAKIVGPLSKQLMFVKSGVADVMIVDQECVRADIVNEAEKVGTRVITTIDQICAGLPDMTSLPVESVVERLTSGKEHGVLVRDPAKVAQIAVKTALSIAPGRRKEAVSKDEQVLAAAAKCTLCHDCRRACPNDLEIDVEVNEVRGGSMQNLALLYDLCMNCARCVSACARQIPILDLLELASRERIKNERFKVRAGRGPILDTEIRNVGRPIVMGEIPGVVAFVGCSNYPNGGKELAEMADEFARRRFIVVASGCSAMDMARYSDENGQSLYEKYPGDFDAGCIANVGSCVANAHIIGAAIKIANIFAKRPLRANFEEIADYILNRVGAVAIAWGAQHQKAASIGTGVNRLGVPVILGPHGAKYRRAYLGRSDKDERWMARDVRTGRPLYVGPAPEHLVYVAETKEEAMTMAARLVMRPSDTSKGRLIKLSNYIDLHRKLFGKTPEDFHLFVRTETDLPLGMKDELLAIMKEKGWKPRDLPELGSTIVDRLVPKKV